MINLHKNDIMDCISAMHLQEKKTPICINYFQRTNVVDESSRNAMLRWLRQISDALSLNRDTVGLAMSLLDRFLSTNTESANLALGDKHKFQLASITTYYIAVKVNEQVALGLDMLVKLCRGFYEQSAIMRMENDILICLEWRISAPTPLDFMRHILALLPSTKECIAEKAEKYMVNATQDSRFSEFISSVVGAACVVISFRESKVEASSEESLLWDELCKSLELDTSSNFLGVQQQLLSKSCNSMRSVKVGRSIATLSRRSSYVNLSEPSSPISVTI